MRRVRIIPLLLLKNNGLVKSVKFSDFTYVGDPINAVKIFNDKEVDELVIMDVDVSKKKSEPNFELIADIAGEAFVPLSYGGGVRSVNQIQKLFAIGIEKVVLNTSILQNKNLLREAADRFGSQSIVACIDVSRNWLGKYLVFDHASSRKLELDPVKLAAEYASMGAGEIVINDVDRDGTLKGYDLQLVNRIAQVADVPVVCCGGAASLAHFRSAIQSGASAAAAGSYFVFKQPHRAVLISYPSPEDLKREIYSQL